MKEFEVLYISKILKTPASFLIIRRGKIPIYRKVLSPSMFLHRFHPVVQDCNSYMTHHIKIAVPTNDIAKDLLDDDDVLGEMNGYVERGVDNIPISTVEMLADQADYPLV